MIFTGTIQNCYKLPITLSTNHPLPVREVRTSNGAEFIVAICGDMMTMPGLPKVPSAEKIDIDENGSITGLF